MAGRRDGWLQWVAGGVGESMWRGCVDDNGGGKGGVSGGVWC